MRSDYAGLLVTGLLARDRALLGSGYILFAETMARDLYRIDPSNPSFITQLLGSSIDPGGVIGASAWGGFWVGIRAANNIIDNVATARDLTAAEKAGTIGLAMTIKAQNYYRALEMRDSLGIPIAVDQPLSAPPVGWILRRRLGSLRMTCNFKSIPRANT